MAFAERPVLGLPVLGTDGVVLPLEGTLGRSLGDMLREVFLRATPPPPRSTVAGSGDRPTKTRAVTHRVGLLASPGDAGLAAVVTQSDVMRWLGTALKSLPEVAGAPVSSLGLGVRGVVGVPADTPALDALQEMRRIGVSALAVLAGDGRLIGNFSASDLRTMLAEHFGALALPVGEYLAREHGTEFAGYTAQTEEETEGDEVRTHSLLPAGLVGTWGGGADWGHARRREPGRGAPALWCPPVGWRWQGATGSSLRHGPGRLDSLSVCARPQPRARPPRPPPSPDSSAGGRAAVARLPVAPAVQARRGGGAGPGYLPRRRPLQRGGAQAHTQRAAPAVRLR